MQVPAVKAGPDSKLILSLSRYNFYEARNMTLHIEVVEEFIYMEG